MTSASGRRRWASLATVAVLVATYVAIGAFAGHAEDGNEATVDALPASGKHFDTTVAPLLAARCLACHNGAELKGKLDLTSKASAMRGGENGEVIVPAKPDDSLLWQYVDADEMPPKKPLAAAEKEILRKWIADGATWGTDPIDRFAYTTDARAGYDWWSLQPVNRPTIPAAANPIAASHARNAIDRFVAARRDENKLSPSPEAARRVLVRRLTLDLLGLPPTPQEVEAFVADPSPDAYERLTDRLLASPHYGERWGRFWLDVVRFGESDGYEFDKLRPNAWPYRDWVIESLNADMPYDEFVRLQLAGDVLRPGQPQGIVATGFLVAGSHDGLAPAGDVMKAIMRQDELEDVVGVICQTFLGLTAHCARCHDHKFDPIRQKDYYSLTSAIAGYSHGERKTPLGRDAAEVDEQIAAAKKQLRDIEAPIRRRLLAERRGTAANDDDSFSAPTPVAAWDFSRGLADLAGTANGTSHGDAKIVDGTLRFDGGSGYVASAVLDREVREKTLEAVVALDNLHQQGGAAISIQRPDGSAFDAIVFGERESGRWMAGSNSFVRTKSFDGPEETAAASRPVHVAIVYRADGTIAAYRDGKPYGKPYDGGDLIAYPAGDAQVLIGLRHSPPGGNRFLAGAVHRAALYDRALSDEEIGALARHGGAFVTAEEVLAKLDANERATHHDLTQTLAALEQRRSRLTSQQVYTCVPQSAAAAHLLVRGNPQQQGDVVAPGGVPTVRGVNAEFGLPPDAPEAERRVKLAAWITDPANPLFARVMVNRLWHYHFGLGLVETPNDFGFNGARPSHPQLLDFLADEFAEKSTGGGFSLKRLHRSIVNSATYRQASAPSADATRSDADNRWLWRKTPLRLEAEVVRDAMLAAAGELNAAMGGPGFQDFRAYVHRSTQFYEPIDVSGAEVQRRTIYRTWARGGRNPFLDALDCPDPSTTTPKRSVTTTPLQAMAMWNNAFVLRMADALAARIEREGGTGLASGTEVARQVDRAYWLTLSRPTTDEERAAVGEFIRQRGLPALCRVLLNSNEFMYVD
ncbi:MAG: DUF1553 domain-containing protein [Pirellulales bacterium]